LRDAIVLEPGKNLPEQIFAVLSDRCVARRNHGDTSMHLGGSVPRSLCLLHAENAFAVRTL